MDIFSSSWASPGRQNHLGIAAPEACCSVAGHTAGPIRHSQRMSISWWCPDHWVLLEAAETGQITQSEPAASGNCRHCEAGSQMVWGQAGVANTALLGAVCPHWCDWQRCREVPYSYRGAKQIVSCMNCLETTLTAVCFPSGVVSPGVCCLSVSQSML